MDFLSVIFVFIIGAGILAYHRQPLLVWDGFLVVYLVGVSYYSNLSLLSLIIIWSIILIPLIILNIPQLRQKLITQIAYKIAQHKLPTISDSERLALEAGTVSWDAELFSGMPHWKKLFAYKSAQVTEEEKEFLEGPVEKLCQMGSSWDLWHKDLAIPKKMHQFANENGFMGFKIPKKYGGREFSTTGTWSVIMKMGNRIGPLSYLITIASSIGCAELLMIYGTDKQKKQFLPGLANGSEISCFALTSPIAGSDATSIEDYGIVCKGKFNGKEVLGIKLNFNKRYITLGPIATLLGLAFRLYDPDHLLGNKEDIGISIALLPTHLPGVTQGRYHYPIGTPFPNGPLQGKDVFIPMDYLLGGTKMAGKAWMMLTHSLAGGRATSLPTGAVGSIKYSFYVTSVYASIRKQFGINIGSFEGVQDKLAELAGYAYIADATRLLTFSQLEAGENPAISAAISKYNSTTLAQKSAIHAVDLHGGKGVQNGPHNYIVQEYLGAPVSITVEGSNTMTRSLIVFGQGAIRCHPFVFKEMIALQNKNVSEFDKLVMKHLNYSLSNHVRALVLGLTKGRISFVPSHQHDTKRYLQYLTHLSAAFALVSDLALMTLGGKLKRMESLSGKFADVFSMLFMGSATLKLFHDQGYPGQLLPVVKWTMEWSLSSAEQSLNSILHNFPNPFIRVWLRLFIFPLGKRYNPPLDKLNHQVGRLVQESRSVREQIAKGIYLSATKENIITQLEEALLKSQKVEDLNKKIAKESKGYTYLDRVAYAKKNNLITVRDEKALLEAHKAVMNIINVDDFSLTQLNKEK